MRLIDKFSEWLIYQPFMEMAYYRKEASDKIRSLSGTIIKHIIKVMYLDDDLNIKHWKSEITSYFDKISDITIKPRNKKFSKEEYYNFLFLEPYCLSYSNWKEYEINDKYIKMIIMNINTQYKSNIDVNDINFDKISNLFKTISEKISNYESIDEIIKKIK
jgi:hypothetical protein